MKNMFLMLIGVVIGVIVFLLLMLMFSTEPNVTTDNAESIVTEEAKLSETPKEFTAPFEIKHGVQGLKVIVTKIENKDILKLHMKYENNSGTPFDICESLYTVVADGKQYQSDTIRALDFIENPLHTIENGVTYESIVVFDKINIDRFNLVASINFKDIRINNILLK